MSAIIVKDKSKMALNKLDKKEQKAMEELDSRVSKIEEEQGFITNQQFKDVAETISDKYSLY